MEVPSKEEIIEVYQEVRKKVGRIIYTTPARNFEDTLKEINRNEVHDWSLLVDHLNLDKARIIRENPDDDIQLDLNLNGV